MLKMGQVTANVKDVREPELKTGCRLCIASSLKCHIAFVTTSLQIHPLTLSRVGQVTLLEIYKCGPLAATRHALLRTA